jgi:hypothetical protein
MLLRMLVLGSLLMVGALAAMGDEPAVHLLDRIDVDATEVFQAGEHPRLWFSEADVQAIRQRVDGGRLAELPADLRGRVDGGQQLETDESLMYDMRPRDLATLYMLTGDREFAERAGELIDAFIADERFWLDPRSKGLTRSAGLLSVTWAYDLCHDAWPEARRQRVSAAMLQQARWVMDSMGRGANTRIANNWQGVRYASAGLAALSCDEPGARELAEEAYRLLQRHIRENLADGVWNPEGIGYTTYPWTFTGPFGIAARRAGLGDLREDLPNTRHTLWTTLVGTVAIPGTHSLGLRPDLSDDHPGYTGRGGAGLAFWYAPPDHRPAVRWMYDYLHPPGQTDHPDYDTTWGAGLYTLLLYPLHAEPQNPAEHPDLGLTFVDRTHGTAIFRSAYHDGRDIVAVANATQRRPRGGHAGPDTNTIRIFGLGGYFVTGGGRTLDPAGQTNLFVDPDQRFATREGRLVDVHTHDDGSGTAVITGSTLGVQDHRRVFTADYSRDAGVPALFTNTDTSDNGRVWRLNTPEFNDIRFDGPHFYITAPHGATLRGTVLEPADPEFRTGRVERGGGADHAGFPYRGTKYTHNTYLEFDVQGDAAVVMTLTEADPGSVEVERSPQGAQVVINDVPVLYDRASRQTLVGDDAAGNDALTRATPLPPRHLRATAVGDRAVELSWQAAGPRAERVLVQRRAVGDAQAEGSADVEPEADAWQTVARLEPAATEHRDSEDMQPLTRYAYRIVTRNGSGQTPGDPAEPIRTWDPGYEQRVEDFAPAGTESPNSLGRWRVVERDGVNFSLRDRPGSNRGAAELAGHFYTHYVPIRQTRAILNEDVRADLSGESAEVSFDVQAQATTVFSPMFKLADGSWVMTGRTYQASRREWTTLRYPLHARDRWWSVDPDSGRRSEDPTDVTPDMLADVRGIGVFMEWVINQKTAAVDQFHLRGGNVRVVGE